jgi:hypothetical protein
MLALLLYTEEKPKTWADMLGRSSGAPTVTVPAAKPQPKVTPPVSICTLIFID